MEFIGEIIALVPELKLGSMSAVGAIITIAVRVYGAFGGPMPPPGKKWIMQTVVFLLSLLATLLVGVLSGGLGWAVAIPTAITIALSSISTDQVTKAIGYAVRTPDPYQPSPFRKAASILLPAPKSTVTISQDAFRKVRLDIM